jgi:hypothetical protein
LGWVALIVGLLLHGLLRDDYSVWTLFFYTMPRPCLVVLALFLACFPKVRWVGRITALGIAVCITAQWLKSSWQPRLSLVEVSAASRLEAGKTPEFSLLFWNLCRPSGLDTHAIEVVQELKPDIAAFVEPGSDVGRLLTEYEARLPGYKVAWMPRGILWLSKLPSRYRDRGKLDGVGAYARFEVGGVGEPFPIVVGDVYPHLFHPRTAQLRELLGHALNRADAVIVGDLNTPRESVHFDVWRAHYQNALESRAGSLHETWPCGLPLLSLDQIWVGPSWKILDVQKLWRLRGSDHAVLFLRLKRR